MTKIAAYSDIHTEFGVWIPEVPEANFIVFAGDILTKPKYVSNYFSKVHELNPDAELIWVLGNHCFYGGDLIHERNKYHEEDSKLPYLHLLDPGVFEKDGVRFIGATLWTDFNKGNPIDMMNAQTNLNDYRKITYKFRRVSPQQIYSIHQSERAFIENELEKKFDGATVVVTHHSPTLQDRSPNRAYSKTQFAYHSDLDDMIYKYQPKLWLHGHCHQSSQIDIENTKVITNARGYFGVEPNPNFDEKLIIEI